MTWPTGSIPTTALDADADSPLSARPALKTMADQVNEIRENGQPALLAGSALQVFSVGNAASNAHALNRQTGDGRYTPSAHNGASAPHPGHALKTTTISASNGLAGGGDLAGNRTISGVDATTSVKGVVQLDNTVTSTSTSRAATAAAAKTAYDRGTEGINAASTKVDTASNLGTGSGVWYDKSGATLRFRSLKVATVDHNTLRGLAISVTSTEITIVNYIPSGGGS